MSVTATYRPGSGIDVGEPVGLARPALARTAWPMAALVAAWLFSISRSIFDPIGYDQALYQYMVDRAMAGQRIYVDVWDQNGPGILLIHWLSTRLCGSGPVALRCFDAAWQAVTVVMLVGLATRAAGRRSVGWMAALLYVLAYYSMGYVQTAQREGFAVLPLLLSGWLVLNGPGGGSTARTLAGRGFAAGLLSLFVFAIKPPLGLCFGLLWTRSLLLGRRERRAGATAWAQALGLSLGFVVSALAGAAVLRYLGAWDGFVGVLTRRDIPGYIAGPALIRRAVPSLAAAMAGFAILGLVLSRGGANGRSVPRLCVSGFLVFSVLLSMRQWVDWRDRLICFAGLWIPAAGSLLCAQWKRRGEAWRLCAMMLGASTAAVILQGQFAVYHLPPLLAFTSVLTATELDDRRRDLGTASPAGTAWFAVCCGAVAWLAAGQWWPAMTYVTARPYVLAGTSLEQHYTAITRHKLSCPTYSTTVRATDRIRELTSGSDPIACLLHDPRIYYFSRRPPVYKLLCMQIAYRHLFDDYMRAIAEVHPKVIVARIPETARGQENPAALESAVFAEAESFFGPCARVIRDHYRLAERIDDLVLLRSR